MKKSRLNKTKYLNDFFSKGSWLALMYRILSGIVNYGLFLLIPIWFGIAELGVFGLVLAWISSLSTLCLLGFNVVLLKTVSQYGFTAKTAFLYKKSLKVSMLFSLALALVLIALRWKILSLIDPSSTNDLVIWIIGISLPFQTLLFLELELVRGSMNIKVSEFFRNLNILLITSIALFFLKESNVPNPSVVAYAIGLILTAIMCHVYVWNKHLKYIDKTLDSSLDFSFKEYLKTSLPMMGTAMLQNWNSRLMIIVLGIFTNPAVVGIFSFAFKLSTLSDIIVSAIKAPGAPLISKLFWQEQNGKLNELLQRSVRLIAIGSIPIAFLLFLFAYPILSLGDEGFSEGITALRILVMAQLFNALMGMTGPFLNMTNNQMTFFQVLLLSVILNFVVCIICIPIYGLNGAALAFLISTICWNVLSARFVFKSYGIRTYFNPFPILKKSQV